MAARRILLPPPRRPRRPCLDDAALARLSDRTLSTDEWAWIVTHLFLCDRCYRRYTARFEGTGAPEPADQPAGRARR